MHKKTNAVWQYSGHFAQLDFGEELLRKIAAGSLWLPILDMVA